MKTATVSGKYLNAKLGNEAEIYLNEKFNENKNYTVLEDASIEDESGHEIAVDFVSEDVLSELNLN